MSDVIFADKDYFKEKVFNDQVIRESVIEPRFTIGVDKYSKDCLTYCLVMIGGNYSAILLEKTSQNESEFDLEVKNLSKYFNADIIFSYEK